MRWLREVWRSFRDFSTGSGVGFTGRSSRKSSVPLQLELLETRLCPSGIVTSANVRYASSSNRIYVTGDVSATLSQLDALLPNAPLDLVDPANHVWLLRANLVLQQGATLNLHGSTIGGDVNELRLLSNNTGAANSVISISADWGTIDIDTTKIDSWDQAANGVDTEYTTYGRAFIRARSSLAADGVTAQDSTMNIRNSDISYLGFDSSESYGLSWKVNGDPGPTFDLYNHVDVFGTVSNSHIHNNFWGVYTFGGQGMQFQNNEVDNNVGYGLDFHDDSDYFVVNGNNVHNNGVGADSTNHGIIFSKRCDHETVTNNTSNNNGGNGIMMHRNSDDSLLQNNITEGNGDSGIAIFDSYRDTISNNTVENNVNGIRFSVGSANNVATGNTIAYNSAYGVYFFQGTDLPTTGDGRPKNNQVTNNSIHDNGQYAVKLGDADGNLFKGNTITGPNSVIDLERGNGNKLDGNVLGANALVLTKGTSTSPGLTYVTNQPSVFVQVDAFSSVVFTDPKGAIFDVGNPAIGTTVTPTGSTLTLTQAKIGANPVLVTTRNFWVTVASQSAVITPTSWIIGGNKAWTTQSSLATQSITYTIGDFKPNQNCTVRKNGAKIASLKANASGTITFTDVPKSTAALQFTVQ